ncbi:Uncharacterised protein [Escherichia coli]|uniref:Uncharacterized protein n=1 Tax=Escherichia coli TaxID=562 RepID=A0A376TX44_ECOLX|nr:Uncharacterised protein [Escherichia coli]
MCIFPDLKTIVRRIFVFSRVLSESNSSELESSMFKSIVINLGIPDKHFLYVFIIFNDYVDIIMYFSDEKSIISGNLILFKQLLIFDELYIFLLLIHFLIYL